MEALTFLQMEANVKSVVGRIGFETLWKVITPLNARRSSHNAVVHSHENRLFRNLRRGLNNDVSPVK